MKAVEEFATEMTREEFQSMVDEQQQCPSHYSLRDCTSCDAGDDQEKCKTCWDSALVGINFKAAVPMLPNDTLPILTKLGELEVQAKSIENQQNSLKEQLLVAMEKHGIKKWDNEVMTITYVAPSTRVSVDSKKLKEELPDVFTKYSKSSKVKSSIKLKLK